MQNLIKKIIFAFLLIALSSINAQRLDFKKITVRDGLPQSDVFDALQDNIGYMWFATQGGGIARYDGKEFKVYDEKKGLLSNFANALFLKNDSLLVGTNHGLSIYYKEKFTNYNAPKINKLCALNGTLYLATEEGVYALKKGYIVPVSIHVQIDVSAIKNIAYFDSFYWIETRNKVWKTRTLATPRSIRKATNREYAMYIKKQQGQRIQYANHPAMKRSTLVKVYIDKQQNTWLLTKGNGVYQSIPTNFKQYTHSKTTPIGNISALHTKDNTVWFSDSVQLFKSDSTGIKTIDKTAKFEVTSITTDSENNLWISSKNKGIFILRKSKDSLASQPYEIEQLHTKNGLPNDEIRRIHLHKDTIWAVTKDAGILKLTYDFKLGFVKHIRRFHKNNGLREHAITTTVLQNNALWYGTKTGSLGYIKENSVTHYSKILGQSTTIQTIVFQDDQVYLGTLGAGIWTGNTREIQELSQLKNTKLTSLNCYQLLFDNSGDLWLGTEKGLDRIALKNKNISKVTHFNQNDGFMGIETSPNTAVKTTSNQLWFGSKNGISTYLGTPNHEPDRTPIISFEKIAIDYQPIALLNNSSTPNYYPLDSEQNNISFVYKTVDLQQPYRTEYQWSLNGSDSPWTTDNSVHFSNLKPGYYTFKVVSRNGNKTKSVSKQFLFEIAQPLYKKGWFIGLVIGGVILIILLFLTSYIERLKEKNTEKIIQLTQKNRMLNLEQKALQLQMNPHFIFNVLNGIKALGTNNKTTEFNHTIQAFSNLLRSILNNSRAEEISLAEEISTLKNYLELSKNMSPVSFSYHIKEATDGLDTAEILIPPMLLQPFVENCIEHGFKGLTHAGNIAIAFRVNGQTLSCSVIDNGVGLKKSSMIHKHHDSVALAVTKERINSFSQEAFFVCKEIIEDNQVIGTKVAFTIPLKTDF